jgi:tetratricopeptide (TPR) repeat protein
MLPELIMQQWLEESSIRERVQQIGSEKFITIQKVFRQISNLSPDEVRSLLTEADKKENRNLAWWLLDTALNLKTAKESEKAKNCVDWAEFVAQFTDSLSNREEALEAHCEFVKGVLYQQKDDLREAQLSYRKAEESYRHANASLVLQGLAIYSQGAVALEADDIEGNRMLYGGSQERFKKALEVLSQSASELVRQQIQEVIESSLQQWEFMNELVKTNQTDDLLAKKLTFVNQSLVQLLRARMRNMAVDEQPVIEVLRVAHLAENIGSRIGKELNCTEELLNLYWHSGHLDAAELILQEQIESIPKDLDLQKGLAGLLANQGKYLESKNLLEKVLEENPDESEVHGLLSFSLLELNDRVGADFHAHRAIEIDPNEYYADLVLQHLKATEPKAAVTFKDGTLAIGPDFSDLAPEEGAALMTAAILADKPEQIEASLKEITQSDSNLASRVISILQTNGILPPPKLPPAIEHYERAEQLFSQARWTEAMQEYKQAIAADHDCAKAYTGLGDVYYRIGQYYVAFAHFEESLAIQPDPYTYRFLGDTYRRVGKRKHAVEAYRQALKLDPNYAGARQALQDSLEEEVH